MNLLPTPNDRSHTLQALRRIARSLSSAVDLHTTLNLIAHQTAEVMAADSCTIYLLDSDGETLRLKATTGLSPRSLGRSVLRVGEGMTGHAVLQGTAVYAAKAQEDPHFKWVAEAEEGEFQALLAVPLIVNDQPLGAINVQTVAARPFTAHQIDLFSFIADLAAGALAKAQLYDNQHRQLQELQMLAHISEAATSPQYLDKILAVIMEATAQAMHTAVCALFLLDEEAAALRLHSVQRSTFYADRPPLPIGRGVIGQVAATAEAIYIEDVRTDPRYLAQERARAEGLVSMLAVPLTVREKLVGVMACYTAEVRHFSESEHSLFNTLANQTALAIDNTQLATNAAIIREMHHRIKNNLQTVAMLMQLQISEAHRLTTADILETNISRIQSIAAVHDVLSHKGFHWVDVREVVHQLVQTSSQLMAHPHKEIEIQVFGDALTLPSKEATSLTLVINELLLNALEHAFTEQKRGKIEISLGQSVRESIVLVRDNGRGLPKSYQMGLGLEIAQTLVAEDLHGRLKFNQPEKGTEVSVRFPRQLL